MIRPVDGTDRIGVRPESAASPEDPAPTSTFASAFLGRLASAVAERADGMRESARRTKARALRAAARIGLATTVLVMSSAYFFAGLSGALAASWGGPPWSGSLVVGSLGIAAFAIAVLPRRRRARASDGRRDRGDDDRRDEQRPQFDASAWIGRHTWLGLGAALAVGLLASSDHRARTRPPRR